MILTTFLILVSNDPYSFCNKIFSQQAHTTLPAHGGASERSERGQSTFLKLGFLHNACTEGPLLKLFFETLEKQPCKQKNRVS